MCVGLSVYDEAQLRAAGAKSRSSPLAPVDIPYCEGLEIISAANVQESPALLAADAGAGQPPIFAPYLFGSLQRCAMQASHARVFATARCDSSLGLPVCYRIACEAV